MDDNIYKLCSGSLKIPIQNFDLTCAVRLNFSPNEDVSVLWNCSTLFGISTCKTEPKNPSSYVLPGFGEGLLFAEDIQRDAQATDEEEDKYQLAML